MGRDLSVVSTHPNSANPTVRSIIDSDYRIPRDAETISFNLKSHKVFLFDKETEARIYFGDQQPKAYEYAEEEPAAEVEAEVEAEADTQAAEN